MWGLLVRLLLGLSVNSMVLGRHAFALCLQALWGWSGPRWGDRLPNPASFPRWQLRIKATTLNVYPSSGWKDKTQPSLRCARYYRHLWNLYANDYLVNQWYLSVYAMSVWSLRKSIIFSAPLRTSTFQIFPGLPSLSSCISFFLRLHLDAPRDFCMNDGTASKTLRNKQWIIL